MMNKSDLILNVFNNNFNLKKFIDFSNELFKGKVKYKSNLEFSPKVKGEFRSVVKSFLELGWYRDENKKSMVLVVVELDKESSIARSRAIQRNFIKDYFLKNGIDSALVAFYNSNSNDWRLSFIKLDYSYKSLSLEEDITPAKRFSFLLGTSEKHHTAIVRFLPLLGELQDAPNVDDIEEVFNIEVVTKEFFEKYCDLYLDIKKCLDSQEEFIKVANEANFRSDEFAKKLMGQLVFLYFLQKKGWLGVEANPKRIDYIEAQRLLTNKSYDVVGVFDKVYIFEKETYIRVDDRIKELTYGEITLLNSIFVNTKYDADWGSGDKNFIRSIFNKSSKEGKNFLKDYLEPIFYNALNDKRGGSTYFKGVNYKIPFLNGGLFQPISEKYDYKNLCFIIPNKIFSNNNKNKQGDIGDGVLDIFDRYAFTMKEDEPLEKEVAVDPEMLGKVFENLLDVVDRKKKGAFYTPREIVHYMCQESLINYLIAEIGLLYDEAEALIRYGDILADIDISKQAYSTGNFKMPLRVRRAAKDIDNALENVKVADPAVGSGAFPLGMVNEIVRARMNLTHYIVNDRDALNRDFRNIKGRKPYELKLKTIQRCIHAVDIERSAVDIAKLRLWLSLVVEENDFRNVKALPNLDYNIMVGNSLLEEFQGVKLFNESVLEAKDSDNKREEKVEQLSLISSSQESENLLEVIYKLEKQLSLTTKEDDLLKLKKELEIIRKTYDEIAAVELRKESEYILDEIYRLQEQFFEANGQVEKVKLKNTIDNFEWLLIEKTVRENNKQELLPKIKEFKRTNTKPYFLWKLNFARVFREKGGFDIVIGNPPYIKERDNKTVFQQVNNSSLGQKYHEGKMDYWYYFLHKAIDISNSKAIISYITPRYWINSKGASKLINRVKNELKFVNVVDIGNLKVFDSVVGYHMIATYSKKNINSREEYFVYKKLVNILTDINSSVNTENITMQKLSNSTIFRDSLEISFESNGIKHTGTRLLGDLFEVSQGVVEAIDKISKKNVETYPTDNIRIGEGVFVLTEEELINIDIDSKDNKLIKPYLNAQDVDRYSIKGSINKYLIYSHKDNQNLIENNDKYRNIKEHLDKYEKYITSSNKPYGIHRGRKSKFFDKPKIIAKNMFKRPEFAYDNCKYYVGMSCSTIIEKDNKLELKYLLALLNSNFALYWFYKNGKRRGIGVDIGVQKLREFPICMPNNKEKDSLIDLVDKLILLYKNFDNNKLAIKEVEDDINELVYNLYGINRDEAKNIESFCLGI